MLTYGLGADAGRTAVSRMTPPSTLLSAPTTARAGQFVISSKNEFGPATRFAIQFRWSHSVLRSRLTLKRPVAYVLDAP